MGDAATSSATVRDEVAELLGISPDSLDPQADLIASGLDSIRMMSLSGRWRKQGIDVGFAALAADPTVQAWSELVARFRPQDRAPQPTPAVQPSDPDEPFPLAPIQHAMWVGRNDDQVLGGVAGHLYVEFDGAGVDPGRLQDAASRLARRHPMLRVEILPDGTQRISDRDLPVTVHDLRELAVEAAEDRLEEIRDAKSHQLLFGEVLEIGLSLLPGGRTRLHVDMDMQAADAVSYRNFMADLASFYLGRDLPELQYTYREYRAALTAAAPGPTDEDRDWWAERIPDLPEPPTLPLVPRAEQRNPRRSIRKWRTLDVETRDALFAAAHRRGVTPAMAVGASYAGALARWSVNQRFLLNLPMFGREPFHPDVDKLVGDFTSSLMLDLDLSDAGTPAARARVVQEALHRAAAHSSYSGLSVIRDLTRHRGTQTLVPFVYTSALGLGDLFAGDVTDQFGSPVWTISQGPQVYIDAQATPVAEGLMINWDVRADAFRPGVVDAMFDYHLDELCRLATDDAAWEAADPPAVTAEQRAVRAAANAVTAPVSGDALHDGFFRTAATTPDAPAVFSGDADLTYAQLREQVLAVTATLREHGVGAGDVVAVTGPKTYEQIPALLGIHAAGAAYLPVGADQPADRAARILGTAGVALALVCGAGAPELPVPALTVSEAVRRGSARAADTEPAPSDPSALAYVLFTSGSTGEPKGVEVTHDASMNTVEFVTRHFGIGPADRCLALSTLECDISVLDVFATLRTGGAVVVVDERHRRDPDTWVRLIDEHGVTVLHFMPGWLEMLVEVVAGQGARLPTVRVVPTGGDWVRTEMVRALRAAAPGVRVAGLGGATETATHNTICEVTGEVPEHWSAVPFGTPLPNNAARVVDARGRDCPDWVPGEFWVSGRGVARGYRGRADLTAEKFVEHDGRIWYRTGDLVRYQSDGTLEFVGRADHRIKISGYRVELGEVEAALRRVPGVDVAVVTPVPAPGGRDVLAALVRADRTGLTAEAVTDAMAALVPAHMVPQAIVIADRIPFTGNGKLDRAAITRILENVDLSAGRGYRAPATVVESALAHIVGVLLDRAQVGADDDFFALGGDSVLATQLVARVRDWLDTPTVMVADVFASRTVAALARVLAAREPAGDRLEQVAELYLEVAGMDGTDVATALDAESVR
ncbi:amino acid adenylation domain-containing protein [Mycobacterium sp. CPCC 205372]|uniref:Phenyloxazoline synthase MbtB n=1 Tax=Mycobacterium hippophais TaxID=3016340 RepID=A0ABT4PPP6_9MYCO|nr:amino acid adenylation domain-containing protein [Mycobacterium hippophais]MCZ8378526.1 amino acid adenylation domain-containing protein [Mycobacterium hippophais]